MKKTLILAYDFPPYVSVGGLRPASWAKYMHEFGIFPIVVTRQWDNKYGNALDYIAPSESKEIIIENTDTATIIRTPYKPNLANKILLKYGNKKYKYIRKFVTAFYETFQWIFNIGTKSQLYFAAKEYIENNKVDIIIATGAPHILFKYASKLSHKYKIPWIADYRDPWTQSKSRSSNLFLKKWNAYFEKKCLKNCNLITTVSEFYKTKIETLIKNKPIHIIYNGYNPDNIDNIKHIQQRNEKLGIAFVGTIYDWHPVKNVLSAFNQALTIKPDLNFDLNFYGINKIDFVKKLINEEFLILKNFVVFYDKMSNEKILGELASNNVMLLFNYYSIIGTKIYDYIGLKRLILFCFSEENGDNFSTYPYYKEVLNDNSHKPQEELIKQTNSGIIIKNKEHLTETLINLCNDFEKEKFIKCNPVSYNFYSRKNQTKILSEIIYNAI